MPKAGPSITGDDMRVQLRQVPELAQLDDVASRLSAAAAANRNPGELAELGVAVSTAAHGLARHLGGLADQVGELTDQAGQLSDQVGQLTGRVDALWRLIAAVVEGASADDGRAAGHAAAGADPPPPEFLQAIASAQGTGRHGVRLSIAGKDWVASLDPDMPAADAAGAWLALERLAMATDGDGTGGTQPAKGSPKTPVALDPQDHQGDR
jgi:hypothetical protein